MAIYGAGSIFGGNKIEKKEDFFIESKFVLGWNDKNAKDLYEAIAFLKIGDNVSVFSEGKVVGNSKIVKQ